MNQIPPPPAAALPAVAVAVAAAAPNAPSHIAAAAGVAVAAAAAAAAAVRAARANTAAMRQGEARAKRPSRVASVGARSEEGLGEFERTDMMPMIQRDQFDHTIIGN